MKAQHVVTAAVSLSLVTVAVGQDCGPAWSDQFGSSDLNQAVLDLAVADLGGGPALYAAGAFTEAGDVTLNYVARLEDEAWMPLGVGVGSAVSALAACQDCFGAGPGLFAGGYFQTAGGAVAYGVARWDGKGWAPLGAGITGAPVGGVQALLMVEHGAGGAPALYAAGHFDHAGGAAAQSIARWDGTAWSALGDGIDGTVLALAYFDDGSGPALYAGGTFTAAGGVAASNLARWDGAAWSAVDGGTSGIVRSLAVFDDGTGAALYAAGDFTSAGAAAASGVARWNGAAWSGLAEDGLTGHLGYVSELAVHDGGAGTMLVAGGSFDMAGATPVQDIATWDGRAWHALGSGTEQPVWALASLDGSLYAGGLFQKAGAALVQRMARWDGSGWARIGKGADDGVTSMLTVDAPGLDPGMYVGGYFGSIGGAAASGIARLHGDTWSSVGGGVDGSVNAMAIFDDGQGPGLYAGGQFTSSGGVQANSIARWDGSAWSPLSLGIDPGHVNALSVFDDGNGPKLCAAGGFIKAGGVPVNNIAAWDGTQWSALGSGLEPESEKEFVNIYALAAFDDGSGPALYAGGYFDLAGGVEAHTVARWDGTAWSPVGKLFDESVVTGFAIFDDGSGPALFACGSLSLADGSPTDVAKWDGTTWTGTGTGASGASDYVIELAVHDDGTGPALYGVGSFFAIGGVPASNVARWNGAGWSRLGSGITAPYGEYPVSVAVYDQGLGDGAALFVGGEFHQAGPHASDNFARWGGCLSFPLADLSGDGVVNITDFNLLLGDWGPCTTCGSTCPSDLDGDCTVGVKDFLLLLSHWS